MNFAEAFRGWERAHLCLHHWQTLPLPSLATKTKALLVLKHRQSASKGRSHRTESCKIHRHDKPRPYERQGESEQLLLLSRPCQKGRSFQKSKWCRAAPL